MSIITHIALPTDWSAAQENGAYIVESLHSEGFIHCSDPHQVLEVARRFYGGQRGLYLLIIDTERLIAPLKYEPPVGEHHVDEDFPHLYGPLNLDAIIRVDAFGADANGDFSLPADFTG